MSNEPHLPGSHEPSSPSSRSEPPAPPKPWWDQTVIKVLLWSTAVGAVVFVVIAVLTVIATLTTMDWMTQDLDAFMQMEALKAAGVFGDGGANGQLIRGVTAVTDALKDNLLGFVGASIILVVIGLAVALSIGDPRAQDRIAKLVQGVLMLAAAAGLVA